MPIKEYPFFYKNWENNHAWTAFFHDISTTHEYNVYCTGEDSCSYAKVTVAKNVYALGYQSLFGDVFQDQSWLATDLSNVSSGVYGYAYESLQYVKISDVGDVYCGSYRSCVGAQISNIKNNILGAGYYVLSDSNIQNASNVCDSNVDLCLCHNYIDIIHIYVYIYIYC